MTTASIPRLAAAAVTGLLLLTSLAEARPHPASPVPTSVTATTAATDVARVLAQVRSHRAPPIVRDHRTKPIVHDHRVRGATVRDHRGVERPLPPPRPGKPICAGWAC